MKTSFNKKKVAGSLLILVLVFFMGKSCASSSDASALGDVSVEEKSPEFWTCSMHPQINNPGPGQCPLCGMDLIPVTADDGDEALAPREIKLSSRAERLAEVEATPVERRAVSHEIRLVGRIGYDETKLAHITAWVPGRLDRLYVDYKGVSIQKNDHLVSLYSPELLAAQVELIQALKTVKKVNQGQPSLLQSRSQDTVDSAREKLRLFGLTPAQIEAIETSKEPQDHLTIYSPVSGTVVHKDAQEGMYVKTGTRIYTIADLSRVWVKLEAYEADLKWLHYGQDVRFEVAAYPGEHFLGRISFIDPLLDEKTRTVKVRINVENPEQALKPGMFVRAVVQAQVAQKGKIIAPELAGKWISPMHPEIIKDAPGPCDICGMPLVEAESLGYVSASQEEAPLVIPVTAPLFTGKRSVVYVKDPERKGIYQGREIVLGARAGDFYVVEEGLEEGELVVTKGNFKIDSAIQILAKPSMMNPPEKDSEKVEEAMPLGLAIDSSEVDNVFSMQIGVIYSAYLKVQDALAHDKFEDAQAALVEVQSSLAKTDMSLLKGDEHSAWMKLKERLEASLKQAVKAPEIEALRVIFSPLSDATITSVKTFGVGSEIPVFVVHCPMALEDGGDWLQGDDKVRNPYFGASMYKCGSVKEALTKPVADESHEGHDHD